MTAGCYDEFVSQCGGIRLPHAAQGSRDAGLAGIIGFHEAGDGYLVTFPQGENVQALIDDYKGRLRDLENNIWQH